MLFLVPKPYPTFTTTPPTHFAVTAVIGPLAAVMLVVASGVLLLASFFIARKIRNHNFNKKATREAEDALQELARYEDDNDIYDVIASPTGAFTSDYSAAAECSSNAPFTMTSNEAYILHKRNAIEVRVIQIIYE